MDPASIESLGRAISALVQVLQSLQVGAGKEVVGVSVDGVSVNSSRETGVLVNAGGIVGPGVHSSGAEHGGRAAVEQVPVTCVASPLEVVFGDAERVDVNSAVVERRRGPASVSSEAGYVSASTSWADEVEEEIKRAEAREGSVGVSGPVSDDSQAGGVEVFGASASAEVGPSVRPPVLNGQVVVAADSGSGFAGCGEVSFMRGYVRVASTEAMVRAISSSTGRKFPRSAWPEAALVTYTAGTVPSAFDRGKEKLNRLAGVGDSALVTAWLTRAWRLDYSQEATQEFRTRGLTDKNLQICFAKSRFASLVSVVGGVSLRDSKTGATALEAIAGVILLHNGPDAVVSYAVAIGLFDSGLAVRRAA